MKSYYHPRREVMLKTAKAAEEKPLPKGALLLAAGLTFAASVLIGRWIGVKLIESRVPIKSPVTTQGFSSPESARRLPGSDINPFPAARQNISSPALVVPPPVVEPKAAAAPAENPAGETSEADRISAPVLPEKAAAPSQAASPLTPAPAFPAAKAANPAKITFYKVQAGMFSTIGNAQDLIANLEQQGYSASFEPVSRPDGAYYRVWIGPFNSRGEAQSASQALNQDGYQTFVIQESGKLTAP